MDDPGGPGVLPGEKMQCVAGYDMREGLGALTSGPWKR